ncbi:hypothetical protein LCGC14_2848160 [marine sediment metagenome]|uniref:Uncharacterized protein n=1 Tax=marine sediment metagenome TaxID=412755 RepID=A0A0F8Y9E1_9ZZZZ
MALQEIIDKIKEMRANKESKEEIPDDVTRDHQLRSLRRMRRIQNEETEKVRLKKFQLKKLKLTISFLSNREIRFRLTEKLLRDFLGLMSQWLRERVCLFLKE